MIISTARQWILRFFCCIVLLLVQSLHSVPPPTPTPIRLPYTVINISRGTYKGIYSLKTPLLHCPDMIASITVGSCVCAIDRDRSTIHTCIERTLERFVVKRSGWMDRRVSACLPRLHTCIGACSERSDCCPFVVMALSLLYA